MVGFPYFYVSQFFGWDLIVFYNKLVTKQLWRNRLGVVRVFNSRDECEELIREEYKKARNSKILILRGMSDFVGKDKSLFESISLEDKETINNKNEQGSFVRVLIASPNSNFFFIREIFQNQ